MNDYERGLHDGITTTLKLAEAEAKIDHTNLGSKTHKKSYDEGLNDGALRVAKAIRVLLRGIKSL